MEEAAQQNFCHCGNWVCTLLKLFDLQSALLLFCSCWPLASFCRIGKYQKYSQNFYGATTNGKFNNPTSLPSIMMLIDALAMAGSMATIKASERWCRFHNIYLNTPSLTVQTPRLRAVSRSFYRGSHRRHLTTPSTKHCHQGR